MSDTISSEDPPSPAATVDSTENSEDGVAPATTTDCDPPVTVVDINVDPNVAVEESLRLKTEGNNELMAGHFLKAIELYSLALQHTPTNAIVLSNRAQAFLKVENYGLAQADATAAIESDASYAKGYYRRASGKLLCLLIRAHFLTATYHVIVFVVTMQLILL